MSWLRLGEVSAAQNGYADHQTSATSQERNIVEILTRGRLLALPFLREPGFSVGATVSLPLHALATEEVYMSEKSATVPH